jgi:endoglucanase
MKRRQFLVATTVAGLCLAAGPLAQAGEADKAILIVGQMRDLSSLELSREMSPGWNLGNTLEAFPDETSWGNPRVTQKLMTAVRAAGFKTVRIPVSWGKHADGNDKIDPAWMARVAEVVGYARKADLYVLLNIHWDGGWMIPNYAHQDAVNARLTKLWTQIANHFKDWDDRLLFAGTNEVHIDGDYGPPTVEYWTVQNSFNQTFVNAVRATGGNNARRHLVVQGFNTNIDYTVEHAVLPTDPAQNRLMMEVHYYDPYDFTLNDKSKVWQWGAKATDPAAVQAWGNEAHVDAQFEKMKTRFVDKGVPVILGEYAASRRDEYKGARAYVVAWDEYVTRSARQHGLVPVYWDNGYASNHNSGLFDRSTGAEAFPDIIRAIVQAGA